MKLGRELDRYIAENITKEYVNFPREYSTNLNCSMDALLALEDQGCTFAVGSLADYKYVCWIEQDEIVYEGAGNSMPEAIGLAILKVVGKNESAVHSH